MRALLYMVAMTGLFGASTVLAQEHTDAGREGADTETSELARRAFEEGTTAYRSQNFLAALRLFEASYALTEAPELLYNLALVQERLGHEAEALQAYQRYLDSLAADNRNEIEDRIARLEQSVTAHEAAERALAPSTCIDADVNPPSGEGLAWALVGGGATLTATGALSLIWALVDIETVNGGRQWEEISSAHGRIPYLSTLGFALSAVGVSALGTGLLWWALRDSPDGPASLTWSVGPLGAEIRGLF